MCTCLCATLARTHSRSATCLMRSLQSPLPFQPLAALRHFQRSPEARSAGQVAHYESAGSLGPGIGPQGGAQSWNSPRVGMPPVTPKKAIVSRGLLWLSAGAIDRHPGSWQPVAKGEAELDL